MIRAPACALLLLVACSPALRAAPPVAAAPSLAAHASEPVEPAAPASPAASASEPVEPAAAAARAPELPECWTTAITLDDADDLARTTATSRYLAAEIRAARTGDVGALPVLREDAARLRDVHALLAALREDAEAWRCPEVLAYETLAADEHALDVRLALRFGEPIGELDVRLHTNTGATILGDRWDAWGGALRVAPSLLLAHLTPLLAAADAAHPDLHVSRIDLSAGTEWWAATTSTESTQCIRHVDGLTVIEAWCWRAPRHEGFLPAIEPSTLRRSTRPDGSPTASLVVVPEPSVRWEVRIPEGTFAVRTRSRSGPSRPIARVAPPDLGALGLVAVGWHRSARRIATPFGAAACGVRGTFRCEYLRPE